MHSTVCANSHHDARTLEVDDMNWNIYKNFNILSTQHDFS